MSNIKLQESDIEQIVRMVIAEGYMDENLPLEFGKKEDVVINRQVYNQMINDFEKALQFFIENKPVNNPQYSDRLNRLNRGVKSLRKSGL